MLSRTWQISFVASSMSWVASSFIIWPIYFDDEFTRCRKCAVWSPAPESITKGWAFRLLFPTKTAGSRVLQLHSKDSQNVSLNLWVHPSSWIWKERSVHRKIEGKACRTFDFQLPRHTLRLARDSMLMKAASVYNWPVECKTMIGALEKWGRILGCSLYKSLNSIF